VSETVRDEFPGRDEPRPDGEEVGVDAASRFVSRRRTVQATALKSVRTVEGARRGVYDLPEEQEGTLAEGGERLLELREHIAELELSLSEQLAIVDMRNLELGRLEGELEQKSQSLVTVETELFHERRRSAELERRWNELAMRYEEVASSLVETGATLQQISTQRSYRTIVRIVGVLRRHRGTDAVLESVARRLRPERAG